MTRSDDHLPGVTRGTFCVSDGRLLRIVAANGSQSPFCIAGVHKIGSRGGAENGDPLANAHLLAASKDLFAAALQAREMLARNIFNLPAHELARAKRTIEFLDAAIDKARGKTA